MAEAAGSDETPRDSVPRGIPRALTDPFLEQEEEDDETTDEQRPIAGHLTSRDNRQRFQRNERSAARAVLHRTRYLVCFVILVAVSLLVAGLYFYCMGWIVWSEHHAKPCDQPLAAWLLLMLLLPLLHLHCSHCGSKRSKICLQVLGGLAIVVGAVLFQQSRTCSKTNPVLYTFVKHYLIFICITWGWTVLLPLILVGVLIYGMRSGWLDDINGARPETIKHLETVTYDPALFAEEGRPDDSRPPGECCCCCEAFSPAKPIKKTPCHHYFHDECLSRWLKVAYTCPLCRNDLDEAVVSGRPSV